MFVLVCCGVRGTTPWSVLGAGAWDGRRVTSSGTGGVTDRSGGPSQLHRVPQWLERDPRGPLCSCPNLVTKRRPGEKIAGPFKAFGAVSKLAWRISADRWVDVSLRAQRSRQLRPETSRRGGLGQLRSFGERFCGGLAVWNTQPGRNFVRRNGFGVTVPRTIRSWVAV